MSKESDVRYVINANDEITFVGDSWNQFSAANDGDGLTGEQILGRSLWDFIADESTRQLYQQIVTRVRQGNLTQFTLRCDGPSCRRLLEMRISARPEGAVEFETRTLWSQDRTPVPLLALNTKRSTELLRICAWCNRINVGFGSDLWVEVEEATERLHLFERDRIPELTHGICDDCMTAMTKTLATDTTADADDARGGGE